MRKFVASVAAAATLAGGGFAVAAINPLTGAGAQDPGPSTPGTTAPGTTAQPAPPASAGGHAKAHALDQVLSDLVQKGTITQAQADAITSAVRAKAATFRDHKGSKHRILENRKEIAGVAAKALGEPTTDLAQQLKSGKSIADVATDKGVDLQKVKDALGSFFNAKIDKAAQDKKVTADQATKLKAHVPGLVDKLVVHRKGEHPAKGGAPGALRPAN